MEKYVRKWKLRMERFASPPSEFPEEGWLRQVLFTPSCRQARQMACSIVESLCQVQFGIFSFVCNKKNTNNLTGFSH